MRGGEQCFLYTLAGLLDANGELEAFAQGEGSTRIAARGSAGQKRGARGGDTAGAGGAVAGVPAGGGNGV